MSNSGGVHGAVTGAPPSIVVVVGAPAGGGAHTGLATSVEEVDAFGWVVEVEATPPEVVGVVDEMVDEGATVVVVDVGTAVVGAAVVDVEEVGVPPS